MSRRKFLVTAGLPYSNGRLHVGHLAGAYLPADIFVRYLQARGDEVRFVCGSDDNGVASLKSAREEGRSVEELTAHYNARQQADFLGMGIHFDIYGGTHQPGFVEHHNRLSQEFFRSIYEKGFFVKRRTQQLYDTEAKQFLPDRYVKGTCRNCGYAEAYGDQCESCGVATDPTELIDPESTITGTRPELRETTHWYLQLQKFSQALEEWLESKRQQQEDQPAWRDMVLNFALGQVRQGLPERAMTRDLDWGVPVPLDDPEAAGKVLYVWFDAPIGYVSFTAKLCEVEGGDWSSYSGWWKNPGCRIIHFIGEDNTVFHALIWPAMMMAEGSYQLPSQVVANAFLNTKLAGEEVEKFSKSKGNAVWIEDYLQEFDPDPLRYYLTAIAPETGRTTFEMGGLIQRNNAELLGAFGNFVNRVLTFTDRYFDGRVPEAGHRGPTDQAHLERIGACVEAVTQQLEGFRFKAALGEMMGLARDANAYFNAKEPWAQRKQDLAGCGTTLNVCIQTVKTLATLAAPFLPFTGTRCAEMLRLEEPLPWTSATEELPPGHELGKPQLLFRPIEVEETEEGGNSGRGGSTAKG